MAARLHRPAASAAPAEGVRTAPRALWRPVPTCGRPAPCAGCTEYVPADVLQEAQRWANFAIAAYGSTAFVWQRPK